MTTIDQRLPSTPTVAPFTIEGPLASVNLDGSAAPFPESEAARDDYVRRRSSAAQSNAYMYQLVNGSGDIAGYISFQVGREGDADSAHIFIDVEAVYAMPAFRGRLLSRLLLAQVISEVQAALHARASAGRSIRVYLHSTSRFETPAGKRLLRALDEELLQLAKTRAGAWLLGQHLEHPPGARERLWALHKRRVASP